MTSFTIKIKLVSEFTSNTSCSDTDVCTITLRRIQHIPIMKVKYIFNVCDYK